MTQASGNKAPAELLDATEISSIRDTVARAVLDSSSTLRAELEASDEAYLKLVAASKIAADEAANILQESITGARSAGHSWDTIGAILGISRQGAQQRFNSPSATSSSVKTNVAPGRKILSPLTAFNEMAALEREGKLGWHSVDYGTLYHLVEASPMQWEHKRLPWTPGQSARKRMEADGWVQIREEGFPWAYFKRQLDLPALSG
ncbi:hypothetical protein [Lysinibacter cavernae]|uniref:Uncharacterized protein n=1 Tax=Lysinibacter cavernae TaxID=1640652 RepID=A0A7X5TTS5_9MICO|nr:hypothetical protein [Lysinibacter cavernae]NIH52927.1 hypothetical protein [Lysinibacter cavernae]